MTRYIWYMFVAISGVIGCIFMAGIVSLTLDAFSKKQIDSQWEEQTTINGKRCVLVQKEKTQEIWLCQK